MTLADNLLKMLAAHPDDPRTPQGNALHRRFMVLEAGDYTGMETLCSEAIEVIEEMEISLSETIRERDEWEARHKEQRTEIAHLRALEAICENRSDVLDGDEGRQLPNEAMSILMEWRHP
jgi:hypothetical protein